MANSDWARETPQQPEQKWFYFQPVLGQIPDPDWEWSLDGGEWHGLPGASKTPVSYGHTGVFWRQPFTLKQAIGGFALFEPVSKGSK